MEDLGLQLVRAVLEFLHDLEVVVGHLVRDRVERSPGPRRDLVEQRPPVDRVRHVEHRREPERRQGASAAITKSSDCTSSPSPSESGRSAAKTCSG